MVRFGLREWGVACVVVSVIACSSTAVWAYYLDKDETMKFGLQTYVNARVGTEKTDKTVEVKGAGTANAVKTLEAQTFPESAAGHVRQNRFFIEAELDHDVTKLIRDGFGPLALLNDLPFKFSQLKYHMTYRGEGEGVYDWGPSEFSSSDSYKYLLEDANGKFNPPSSCPLGKECPDVPEARKDLRHRGVSRNRLFQAYMDFSSGDFFLRAGRQILSWGETDAFRLIDNINPIDSSFGGFLIDLDERRVPLDMLRTSYRIGEVGDTLSEIQLEGFAAIDNKVSYYPGSPAGSPWTLPNLGAPSGTTQNFVIRPPRSFQGIRGGGRLLFNAFDATFGITHYYTYADNPLVQTCVVPRAQGTGGDLNNFPPGQVTTQNPRVQQLGNVIPGCPVGIGNLPTAQFRPVCNPAHPTPGCRKPGEFDIVAPSAYAVQLPQKMQISGLTATSTIPATISRRIGLSGEPVIRSELAYIKDEPHYTQSQLDPFTYHPLEVKDGNGNFRTVSGTGGTLTRDSINFVIGADTNQFIRSLNAVNSFFITTQFFYKHIKGNESDAVLPVPAKNIAPVGGLGFGAVEPIFVREQTDSFLQTLLISTSYRSGTVNPSFVLFYDWSGGLVYIPSVTFVFDPFRLTLQANFLDAGTLKGNSGVSLLRDRDNVLFQLEYVI